jgi:inhibitor of cysteine peptidase
MTTITIGPAANRGTLDVRQGDEVVVRLPENPTTGYRWQLEKVEGAPIDVQDSFEPGMEAVGSEGVRVLTLARCSPGATTLHLRLRRAWEPPEQGLGEFQVTLVCR